jgi:hypothetical protein
MVAITRDSATTVSRKRILSQARTRRRLWPTYARLIGRWKKMAHPDVIRAYQQLCDEKITELAEAFLLQNSVKVEWR